MARTEKYAIWEILNLDPKFQIQMKRTFILINFQVEKYTR